jgi:hypothetical protein
VIYFCTKQQSETAGLGSVALRARAKKGLRHRITVFESVRVMDAFKKAGFTEFYKVVPSAENAELIKKYRVRQANTLVFCAPNEEPVVTLAGMQCTQTNVLKVLSSWKIIYQSWQKKFAAK